MKQHKNEVKSQFLKNEIRKFSIEFSKNKAKLRREKISRLEV